MTPSEAFSIVLSAAVGTTVSLLVFHPHEPLAWHQVIQSAQDSVVFVTATKDVPDEDGDDTVAWGSGIVLDREGRIGICAHQLHDATGFRVLLHDGRVFHATLAWKAQKLDAAIIRIIGPAPNLKPATLGPTPEIGDSVVTLSNPGSQKWLATAGIVGQMQAQVFTLDAAINPGSSGGAVLDSQGRVVGMISAMVGPPPIMFFEGYAEAVKAEVLQFAKEKAK